MAVLTDKKIKELIKEGKLKITPFEEIGLTSNGYDLLSEDFKINPGEFKVVLSIDKLEMPEDVIAIPILRTTYAFKGLILSPGIIDAGFKGHLKLALFNASKEIISLEENKNRKRLLTLLFLKTEGKVGLPFGQRREEKNNQL